MSPKQFRALILLYVLLLVASTAAPFLPGGYSQALSDAFDNEPTVLALEHQWLSLALFVPLVMAVAAGLYGLYMFRRWGRALSLYSTLAGLLLFPFFGPSLSTGLEDALYEASAMLWGAILALSYQSSIAASFGVDRGRNQPTMHAAGDRNE